MRGSAVSARDRVIDAVRNGRASELEELIARDRRAVRYLVSLAYRDDDDLRNGAAEGLAIAARHHPKMVQEVVRRLIWAMNDESGTNAVTAPQLLRKLAQTSPGLLVPFVPDLLRLTSDPSLKEPLVETVRLVAAASPRDVGVSMREGLRTCGQGNERGSHGRD
jgi:hypothetical protein